MKIKKIKLLTFSLLLLPLCVVIMGSGCEKEEENGEFIEKEFFRFSDFGCENKPWHLKSGYENNHHVITSQQEFEKHLESDCIPQIDFTNHTVLIGNKMFSTGIDHYDEKVEENNSEIVYTVTFLTNIATVAQGVTYHVVIEKPSGKKEIKVVEIVKDHI